MKLHSKGKLKTLAALTILSVALGMGQTLPSRRICPTVRIISIKAIR